MMVDRCNIHCQIMSGLTISDGCMGLLHEGVKNYLNVSTTNVMADVCNIHCQIMSGLPISNVGFRLLGRDKCKEPPICDPFYQNEMLLCMTPNRDMAENTCSGDFEIFAEL